MARLIPQSLPLAFFKKKLRINNKISTVANSKKKKKREEKKRKEENCLGFVSTTLCMNVKKKTHNALPLADP